MGDTYTIEPPDIKSSGGFTVEAPTEQGPNLVTGEGMQQYAQNQARKTQLPEPKAGVLSAPGKTTGITSTTDPMSELASQVNDIRKHPASSFMLGAKQLAMAPVNMAYQATHHPIDTATAVTGGQEFAKGIQDKNVGEAAGALLGGLNAYALAKSAQSLPDLANNAAASLNKAGIDPVEAVHYGAAENTIGKISQQLGVSDPPPAQLLTKAIKPGKANINWDRDIQNALAHPDLPSMKSAEQNLGHPVQNNR